MTEGRVSYTKEMRQTAIEDGKGLVSFEIVDPGNKPGKLGDRIRVQGPLTPQECKKAHKLLLSLVKCIYAESKGARQ